MKILVVDDERKIANALAERLALRGFDATPAYDGTSSLSMLRRDHFDGIILDLRLPDIDGIDILRQVKEEFPDMTVVILSGHATEQDFETCLRMGARACFQKPADISQITKALAGSESKSDEDISKSFGHL